MLRYVLRGVLLLVASTTLAGCASAESPWVELRGRRFQVEIAADDASRERGLMFRDNMPADQGMLFVFDAERPQAFWMKNTRIALDILYFDAQRRLVSASERTPPCTLGDGCPSYASAGPARFTLELNAGIAHTLGVKRGDELVLGPGIVADP